MDSSTINFILEWAFLPLALVVIWMIRKVFFLDSKVEVMKAESEARTAQTQQNRIELLDAINTHHTTITARLTSIEEHLRNGRK